MIKPVVAFLLVLGTSFHIGGGLSPCFIQHASAPTLADTKVHGTNIPEIELHAGTIQPLKVPPFGFSGFAMSDSRGNFFFLVGHGMDLTHASVMRVSAHTGEAQVYVLPEEAGATVTYGVSPAGRVYMIGLDKDSHYTRVEFGLDGTTLTTTRLNLPASLVLTDFLISNSGAMVIGGYFNSSAPEKMRGKQHVALYDNSGNETRVLSNVGANLDLAYLRNHLFDGATCIGSDNEIYIARAESLRVYDMQGRLIQRGTVPKPDASYSIGKIQQSGHFIVVWLRRPRQDAPAELKLLLLTSSTLQPFRIYYPDAALGTIAVGFDETNGFTFLKRTEKCDACFISAPIN